MSETKEKTKDFTKEIKQLLKISLPELKLDAKHFKHLNKMAIGFKVKPDEIVKVFKTKYNSLEKKKPKQRIRTAFSRTASHFKKGGQRGAKSFIGYITGISHRVNDISGGQLTTKQTTYNTLIDKGEEEKLDAGEIDADDYIELYKEFDTMKKTANEDDAYKYMKKALKGAWFFIGEINKDIEDDTGLRFINTIDKWKSGSKNFDFGKILISNPSKVMTAILFIDDEPKHVVVNIKGTERLKKLANVNLFETSTITVVPNDDKKWYVDNSFAVEPLPEEEVKSIFDTTDIDKIHTKMISYLTSAVDDGSQVTFDEIDEWEQEMTTSKKKNNVALISGNAYTIRTNDNGSMVITIKDIEEIDLDDEDFDYSAEDDEEDEDNLPALSISVSADKADLIDFDDDSHIYVIGEVYRGKKWDKEAKKKLEDDAEMPTVNAWGIIADPELKVARDVPKAISADSFETEAVPETDDEEDEEFEVDTE